MTDRYRRQQRRRRRVFRLVLVLAVILTWRFFGPGIAVIRTEALQPLFQFGDIVWTSPRRVAVERGDTVSVGLPFGSPYSLRRLGRLIPWIGDDKPTTVEQPRFAPRIVVAVAGDRVTWNDRLIVVRTQRDTVSRYAFPPVHPRLTQPTRQRRVPPDSVFVVALQPGRIDSRVLGPISTQEVGRRFTRILLPANRRRLVDASAYLTPPPTTLQRQ